MIDIAQLEPRCDLCRKEVEPEDLETVQRYYCRGCAAAHDLDVPLCKAATESLLAELEMRELRPSQITLAKIGGLCLVTPAEKDILDAAKQLACKPVRSIVDDREDSENRGASVPAPTGMMTLGGRGQIRAVCQAVIRWRAAVENSGPGGVDYTGPIPNAAGAGLLRERCPACGAERDPMIAAGCPKCDFEDK